MPDGTVTSADGTTIAYTAWGTGDPIVIIDGASAYRATNPLNQETAQLLAGEFLVINYDRRGRGESGDTLPYAGGKIARYYLAETTDEDVKLPISAELGRPEHDEWRWVNFDEAEDLLSPRLAIVLDWARGTLPPADP